MTQERVWVGRSFTRIALRGVSVKIDKKNWQKEQKEIEDAIRNLKNLEKEEKEKKEENKFKLFNIIFVRDL